MKNAVPRPSVSVSNLDVLEAISDQLTLDIITTISNHVANSHNVIQILGITHKQYYSRSSKLLNIGIISRRNGEIILTSFGRLGYKAQLKIANAFAHYSELRMIGAIRSHCGIPDDEQKTIIEKLLDDAQLKNLNYCCID